MIKTERTARRGGAKDPKRRRRRWPSRLTLRILIINLAVLLIPVLGLLHLDQYRASLVQSELEALDVQGRAFALSLANVAAIEGEAGEDLLRPVEVRQQMRILFADTGVRARVFNRAGVLVADSFALTGAGAQIEVVSLDNPETNNQIAFDGFIDSLFDWLPKSENLPAYQENEVQKAPDYPEVEIALQGGRDGLVRRGRRGRLVFSAAVPVKRYRQVVGALMLTKDGSDVDRAVKARRRDIIMVFAITFGVMILLSLYLAGTIARPIHRLARAADQMRHGQGRKGEIPDFRARKDEIGDLSAALRDMTTALWDRLDAIEGFAADVSHEIKNPLSSLRSAVETVARIKDSEQQKRLMTIIVEDVERLDRLISDISHASRLDAELSRAELEEVDIGLLLGTLVDVHEATTGNQENPPRFALDLPAEKLRVQGLEGQLGQVFRNIIANAITFSPPGGLIRLAARASDGQLEISVEDEGPGLPEGKLDAVFDRFYSERPSDEKFGTHSGLGLSISRQIVEAHGGVIRAENRSDSLGNHRGARFLVTLPI